MQRKWKRRWQRVIARVVVPPVAAGMMLMSACGPAWAAPTDGTVTGGAATITTSGTTTTVTQTTNRAAINWQSFGIAAGETVNFVQPSASAVALNRVVGNSASNIYGTLTANGKVYLVNPNGILFAPGSQVNVGGLVASTLNMADSDFMNGKYVFTKSGGAGAVINQGSITAGDHAVFIGPQVRNEGTVAARVTGLAAGDKVSLDFTGDKLLNVAVDTAAAGSSVTNSGTITADGGLVLMTTGTMDALLNTVVNNGGVIRAQTVANEGGVIKLIGSTVNVGGTLDASAPNGGDGGFIDTSGAKVKVAEGTKITTLAASGKNGKWLIDPDGFTIAATGGDVTPTDVQNALQDGDVEIRSTQGGGADGNINVNDAVTWSANELALIATNDVNINAVLTASGTSSLYLGPGSGKVNMGLTAAGTFRGRVDFPGRTGSGFFNVNGTSYTVIADVAGLQGMTSGYYALGANIDASAGFTPLAFSGGFDGLGHIIDGLHINSTNANVGLFSYSNGVIRNVGLTNVNITASSAAELYVGALVARNYGSVYNVYSTGTVTGTGTGSQSVLIGGLVGYNEMYLGNSGTGIIANTYSTATVTGTSTGGGFVAAGGLMGSMGSGSSVAGSYSGGTVVGTSAFGVRVGGLAGENYDGTIADSYSTATVSGTSTGGNTVMAGGLVGLNIGSIARTYSTGSVIGSTSGAQTLGGLVGTNEGMVAASYWDVNTSGRGTGIGFDYASGSVTGLTTAQMKQSASFSGWGIATTGGSSAVWRMYEGYSAPLLRSFLIPVTVGVSGTKTYDGTTGGSSNWLTNLPGGVNYDNLAFTAGGSAMRNAGIYANAVASGLYSGQLGYDISYAAGTVTINKAALTVTASGQNKTYDGTTGAAVTYGDNRVSGDSLTVSGTAAFADKNAGTGKAVGVSGISLSGADAGNYNLTGTTAATTADIARATLTVTADNATKTQGQPNPAFTASYSGLGAGDTAASLTGGLTFGTTATATSSVGGYAISLTGTLASPNYIVSYVNGVLTVRAATSPVYTGAVGGALQLARSGSFGGSAGGLGGGGFGGSGSGGFGGAGGGFAGGMGGSPGGLGGTTALGGLLGISGGGLNLGGAGQGGLNQ